MKPETSHYILVLTTCPNLETAEKIARACLEKRLAACVQISNKPCKSLYWWKEQLESAEETQLLFKSLHSKWEPLRDEIKRLHPFEVPEILSIPIIDGYAAYLDWLSTEISK